MKATGVVRRIDELGRIVIPKELRKNLRIKEGENLEIYTIPSYYKPNINKTQLPRISYTLTLI